MKGKSIVYFINGFFFCFFLNYLCFKKEKYADKMNFVSKSIDKMSRIRYWISLRYCDSIDRRNSSTLVMVSPRIVHVNIRGIRRVRWYSFNINFVY